MTKSTPKKTDHKELRIDRALLKTIRGIIERRDTVQDLIAKAELSKTEVKPGIYERVLGDYRGRLDGITSELQPVTEQFVAAVRDIAQRKIGLVGELDRLSEDIEEQRFRCDIGEFETSEFDRRVGEKKSREGELKTQLGIVDGTFSEAKPLLAPADYERATSLKSLPPPPPPEALETAPRTEARATVEEPIEIPDTPIAPAVDALPLANSEPLEALPAPAEPEPTGVTEVKAPVTQAPPPPAETKKEEAKPEDAKAVEDKAVEAKAVEAKPVEAKPVEAKPVEAKPVEAKPVEAKPVEAKPEAAKPTAETAGDHGVALKLQKGGETKLFPLSKTLTIGRSSKSDIVIKVATVSRTHAKVQKAQGGWHIVAAGRSGTIVVNGQELPESLINAGDVISVGSVEMEVVAN